MIDIWLISISIYAVHWLVRMFRYICLLINCSSNSLDNFAQAHSKCIFMHQHFLCVFFLKAYNRENILKSITNNTQKLWSWFVQCYIHHFKMHCWVIKSIGHWFKDSFSSFLFSFGFSLFEFHWKKTMHRVHVEQIPTEYIHLVQFNVSLIQFDHQFMCAILCSERMRVNITTKYQIWRWLSKKKKITLTTIQFL